MANNIQHIFTSPKEVGDFLSSAKQKTEDMDDTENTVKGWQQKDVLFLSMVCDKSCELSSMQYDGDLRINYTVKGQQMALMFHLHKICYTLWHMVKATGEKLNTSMPRPW